MRDILKSIFTEYSVQLWQKIKTQSDEQNDKIQALDETIQDVANDIGSVMMGDSAENAESTKIFFKVIE